MKQTLRHHHGLDQDEEGREVIRRGHRHLIRKHQHKHHEGDRKRWRDTVSQAERKRYEGVWAANRGLWTYWDFSVNDSAVPLTPVSKSDVVLNIVVREVWNRSRLPSDVLEGIWDLVAVNNSHGLPRTEFVVGMWLIDQSLKGRKLPSRIGPSVWDSVRHTVGLGVSTTRL